ncbi:anthranilate phosphoribosyltransferase [Terrimicrobium sacchariphilum]|uniref:Anthranilate phosphoribosyltransferase n=1 Tax=Terrimicrobium sacchariphilum TaxID=690879 RepID=A0A146GDL6_TERSA|nr:anthranilate phosphoribosyltransferase [Terrimicrobium sacchariphilum]GAT35400.1 anthranilate phosphoribosyltransferase [Terrimicrobium sacchariphilum]
MLAQFTEQLRAGAAMTRPDIETVCSLLLDEGQSIPMRADFLRALEGKGATADEIASFVEVLLLRANSPAITPEGIIDVCGTGGDRHGLVNISTASMFVTAGCGIPVVKHGNRGVTSKSGGADVLEALGVRIDTAPEQAAEILERAGCVFLFAPRYHPTFKAIAPVRKLLAEEGTPTIFNLLGPLLNPAKPEFQLAGVFNPSLLPLYAEVFRLLGRHSAWAVHGESPEGGLDEVSTLGPTTVHRVEDGEIFQDQLDTEKLPIFPAVLTDLKGGGAEENARTVVEVLEGSGPVAIRQIIALNAACSLLVTGAEVQLDEAFRRAEESISAGRALESLNKLRRATN